MRAMWILPVFLLAACSGSTPVTPSSLTRPALPGACRLVTPDDVTLGTGLTGWGASAGDAKARSLCQLQDSVGSTITVVELDLRGGSAPPPDLCDPVGAVRTDRPGGRDPALLCSSTGPEIAGRTTVVTNRQVAIGVHVVLVRSPQRRTAEQVADFLARHALTHL